ncbi:ECF transporter S component [Alicyclobacillus cycloheptanicus]|uniref:Energy-coupling factor transport system substrate-specific component n=1 Tax=Alicyclobacillus cycloheptanicus TaxID=1457 RepID=A0ABT9XI81_9BACL|nr:ECF transporter S component [Alicyclobacillus cycloheptanicus]MDQ0190028.1 energy-coupling factor transport system substrate-specific component [Alicyclobacillus cycloheptanicus]WDM00070.1 ECF transporter S component [Alicyclobacillus cycloheptanicus]
MNRTWKLRDIVLMAILAVVGGGIFYGWDLVTAPLFGPAMGPAVGAMVNGIWWFSGSLVAYIIRRPGAALVTNFISAFFEFAFGSPYGAGAMISGLIQGAGAEAGFAVTGWRRYGLGSMLLSGAIGGVGNVIQWLTQYQGYTYTLGNIIGYIVVTLVSGMVLAGLLPKLIGDALRRTGALRNFEIGRQHRSGRKAAAQ